MMEYSADELRPWLRASIAWDNLVSEFAYRGELSAQSAEFTAAIVDASIRREITLPQGSIVYRARSMPVDRAFDTEPLDLSEMGAPPAERAGHNRLSETGESTFYGALEPDTAIAEVRPWVTARVSIAKFEGTKSLRLVDFTQDEDERLFDHADWSGWIMSRPVHQDDTDSYLGTQLIAARLKAAGFDGVLYRSRLSEGGTNVALFDGAVLNPVSAELREVTRVEYNTTVLTPFPS